MHRKSGFPTSNCSIKPPDGSGSSDYPAPDDFEPETQQRKRQQLINFGHSQWGFNNWSWCVTRQDLDFVDLTSNGKHCAGVVAFVSIIVKDLGVNREDVGYATSVAQMKGSAIYQARKCSVTNALRETMLSFGGTVATQLFELLELNKIGNSSSTKPSFTDNTKVDSNLQVENISPAANLAEARNLPSNCCDRIKVARTDFSDSSKEIIFNTSAKMSTEQSTKEVPTQQKATVLAQNTVKPFTKPLDTSCPANQIQAMTTNNQMTYPDNQLPVRLASSSIANPLPAASLPNSISETELSERVAEEQRAERKRRQRQLQEQFRLKQMEKQMHSNTD